MRFGEGAVLEKGRSRWRLLAASLGVTGLMAACSTPPAASPPSANGVIAQGIADCMPGQRLAVAASCRLLVKATSACVPLPLALAVGERYRFELPAGQRWNDWDQQAVDPMSGDTGTAFMNLFKPLRAMPEQPWMVLGMATSICPESAQGSSTGCTKQNIRPASAAWQLDVLHPMTIAFFANDVPFMNWNNAGEVWVTVQRLGGP